MTVNRRTVLRAVGVAAVAGVTTQATPVAAEPDATPTPRLDASAMTGYWASVSKADNGRGSPRGTLMPKQIVFVGRGVTSDFDSVSCWPKQWFPDGDYEVRAEPLADDLTGYRLVVIPETDLPVPDSGIHATVEVGVDFLDAEGGVVTSLRDTVRPPGRPADDQEACDPVCVE
jgi:hypothetical protein